MPRNNKDFDDAREHVMDYSVNPKTGKVHEIIQKGDYMGAPVYTSLLTPEERETRR
jgi:hypothetical protein